MKRLLLPLLLIASLCTAQRRFPFPAPSGTPNPGLMDDARTGYYANVVPYLDTSIVGNGFHASDTKIAILTVYNKYRVRQTGSVTRIAVANTDTTGIRKFYVRFWRIDEAGEFDSVATSGDLRDSLLFNKRKVITLPSPITGVREGDYVGLYVESTTSATWMIGGKAITGSKAYYTADATGSHYGWTATDVLDNYAVPIECFMDAPRFVFLGDSHTGWQWGACQAATNGYLAYPFPSKFGVLSGATYQNMGISGEHADDVAARFATDVTAAHPTYGVILIGTNDLGATTIASYQTSYLSMLEACMADTIKPVVVSIPPYTNGSEAAMQKRDSLNKWLSGLRSTYGFISVNLDGWVGQYRAGGDAGNLWDQRTAYNFDSVHFTESGYQQFAQAIWDSVGRYTGSWPSVPVVTTTAATSIQPTTATVNGTVRANGASSTTRFLWGTTSNTYTDSATATESPAVGWAVTNCSYPLTGLTATTKYYFRIAVSYTGGYIRGVQDSLTTGAENAITFDTTKVVASITVTSTLPLTVVIGSVANNYVVAGCSYGVLGDWVPDSMKVDGTGGGLMTLLAEQVDGANQTSTKLWGLKNVQSGSRTFTVYGHGTTQRVKLGIVSLFGVDQTTPTGATVDSTITNDTSTVAITNATGNWVVDIAAAVAGVTSPAANQTLAWKSEATNPKTGMSYKSASGTTVSWAFAASSAMTHCAVVINRSP